MPFTRLSLSPSLSLSLSPYTHIYIYSVVPTPRYLPSFSLFPAEVRSPTGSTRPSLLYVIAVEGMGTGLRGHRIPTSVFPPRCAITHHRGTRRTELSTSCSPSIFISLLSLSLSFYSRSFSRRPSSLAHSSSFVPLVLFPGHSSIIC